MTLPDRIAFLPVFVMTALSVLILPLMLNILPASIQQFHVSVASWLWERPILLWCMLIACFGVAIVGWGIIEAPYQKRQFYLWVYIWVVVFVLSPGADRDKLEASVHKLQQSRATGFLISLTSIITILLVIEMVMRATMVYSDGIGSTLPNQRWKDLYWQPLNSLGYRDYEPDLSTAAQTVQVLVIGDSFAAGQGINSIENTFPHLLGHKLGPGYTVHIAAWSGASPHVEMITSYPIQPDMLVLSHYINDIEYTLPEQSHLLADLFYIPPAYAWLVNHFYLPNFLYWRSIAFNDRVVSYRDALLKAYTHAGYWEQHAAQLQAIVDWVEAHGTAMLVIVWPVLDDPEASRESTVVVSSFFEQRRIPVVNMLDTITAYPFHERVVNVFDVHPGAALHIAAAEALYNRMIRDNLVPLLD